MLLNLCATRAVSLCLLLSLLRIGSLSTATPTPNPPTPTSSPTAGGDNTTTKGAHPVTTVFPSTRSSTTVSSATPPKNQSTNSVTEAENVDSLNTHTPLLVQNLTTESPETAGKLKTVVETAATASNETSPSSSPNISTSGAAYKASVVAGITTAAEKSRSTNTSKSSTALTTSPPFSSSSLSSSSSSSSSISSSSSQPSSTSSPSQPMSAQSSQTSSEATPKKSTTDSTTTTTTATITPTSQTAIPPTTPKMVALRADVSTVTRLTTTVGNPLSPSSFQTEVSSTRSHLSQAASREAKAAPPVQAASGRKGKELTGAQIVPPDVSKTRDIVMPQPLKVAYEDLKATNKTTTKKNLANTNTNTKGKQTKQPPSGEASASNKDSSGPPPPASKTGDHKAVAAAEVASPDSCQPCSQQQQQQTAPALRYQAAVSAVLTHHFGPDKEVIVPFDLELVDLADNYDNESGVFFCSIPGTYVISVHLMSHPGSKVNARIFINSRPVAALWADDNKNGGFYPSSSIQTISQLGFGDQVYVMLVDGGYGDSWVHANYNVFTLFLLYEDFMGR